MVGRDTEDSGDSGACASERVRSEGLGANEKNNAIWQRKKIGVDTVWLISYGLSGRPEALTLKVLQEIFMCLAECTQVDVCSDSNEETEGNIGKNIDKSTDSCCYSLHDTR